MIIKQNPKSCFVHVKDLETFLHMITCFIWEAVSLVLWTSDSPKQPGTDSWLLLMLGWHHLMRAAVMLTQCLLLCAEHAEFPGYIFWVGCWVNSWEVPGAGRVSPWPQSGGPSGLDTRMETLVVTPTWPHWGARHPQSKRAPVQWWSPSGPAVPGQKLLLQCGHCSSSFTELPAGLYLERSSWYTAAVGPLVVSGGFRWCQECRNCLSG